MDELGLAAVVVPPHPGLFSAAGLLAANVRIDDAQSLLHPLGDDLVPELLSWFRDARARLIAQLRDDGIARSRIRVVASADCRYEGQGYELELPVGTVSRASIRRLRATFDERHELMYGHAAPDAMLEVVTLRLSAFGDLDRHAPPDVARGSRTPPRDAKVTERRVILAGSMSRRVPVYRRDMLRSRNVIEGPAIVAEMDSTTVIGRGHTATTGADGTLWLRKAHP
jgi:N-methylhydantoinase A